MCFRPTISRKLRTQIIIDKEKGKSIVINYILQGPINGLLYFGNITLGKRQPNEIRNDFWDFFLIP